MNDLDLDFIDSFHAVHVFCSLLFYMHEITCFWIQKKGELRFKEDETQTLRENGLPNDRLIDVIYISTNAGINKHLRYVR